MKKLIMGNDAVAIGALKAGLGLFAGYPITPASEIMHYLAKEKDIEFVHCEDEIASINMIIGASLSGKKVMTATSGPGFSLMQEGLGLGYMTETPIVVVNSQRVGPSTGMPTLPSQGDVFQACYGSHGDTYPIVFYPNSVEDCFKITVDAFNCAEEARQPVIILLDAFISHMHESVDLDNVEVKIIERGRKKLGEGLGHITGLISEDNVPKTKNPEVYRKWLKNVKEKRDKAVKKYNLFEYIETNDRLIIAYGIASRVVLDLKNEYSIFIPKRLFPVLEEIKEISKKYKEIIVVEMNDGQYANILEGELKREIKKINILGGEISSEDVRKRL